MSQIISGVACSCRLDLVHWTSKKTDRRRVRFCEEFTSEFDDPRNMRFAQKVAVVTGGASGLGRAGAGGCAREGAKGAGGDRWPEIGRETVSLIRARGGEAGFPQ